MMSSGWSYSWIQTPKPVAAMPPMPAVPFASGCGTLCLELLRPYRKQGGRTCRCRCRSQSECCVAGTACHWLPVNALQRVPETRLPAREAHEGLEYLTSLWEEALPPKVSPQVGLLFTCRVTWNNGQCPGNQPLSWIHSRQQLQWVI